MRLEKLGDNLYELRQPFWSWGPRKLLTEAILKLQSEGKVVTFIKTFVGFPMDRFLIITADK